MMIAFFILFLAVIFLFFNWRSIIHGKGIRIIILKVITSILLFLSFLVTQIVGARSNESFDWTTSQQEIFLWSVQGQIISVVSIVSLFILFILVYIWIPEYFKGSRKLVISFIGSVGILLLVITLYWVAFNASWPNEFEPPNVQEVQFAKKFGDGGLNSSGSSRIAYRSTSSVEELKNFYINNPKVLSRCSGGEIGFESLNMDRFERVGTFGIIEFYGEGHLLSECSKPYKFVRVIIYSSSQGNWVIIR